MDTMLPVCLFLRFRHPQPNNKQTMYVDYTLENLFRYKSSGAGCGSSVGVLLKKKQILMLSSTCFNGDM